MLRPAGLKLCILIMLLLFVLPTLRRFIKNSKIFNTTRENDDKSPNRSMLQNSFHYLRALNFRDGKKYSFECVLHKRDWQRLDSRLKTFQFYPTLLWRILKISCKIWQLSDGLFSIHTPFRDKKLDALIFVCPKYSFQPLHASKVQSTFLSCLAKVEQKGHTLILDWSLKRLYYSACQEAKFWFALSKSWFRFYFVNNLLDFILANRCIHRNAFWLQPRELPRFFLCSVKH